jgi:hypothetical protein
MNTRLSKNMNQSSKEIPEIMKLIEGPPNAIRISFLGSVISLGFKAIPPKANSTIL